ncbi:hypothetical protein D3C71_2196020 [compost metagenome]
MASAPGRSPSQTFIRLLPPGLSALSGSGRTLEPMRTVMPSTSASIRFIGGVPMKRAT